MGKSEKQSLNNWINNYGTVSKWFQKYKNIVQLVNKNGIVKISNFLPDFIADGILNTLENLPSNYWNETSAKQDYTHNNISHTFKSSRMAPQLENIFRVLSLVMSDKLFTFSAGKYSHSDHIDPHDDKAFTKVTMEDGKIVTCSREYALILYLTKEWKKEYGGLLVDLEADQSYIPEFNSIICFRIPRMHQVTPVLVEKFRFSIYGWFLQPGQLYEIDNVKFEEDKPKKKPLKTKKKIKKIKQK